MQGWLVPHQKKVQLLPQYQEALNCGKSFVAGPGRKPMLEKHDMGIAKGALKTLLEDQRKSGAAINSSIIRSLTIGVLLVFGAVATIAGVVFNNGTTFSVNRQWCRKFASQEMGWSYKKATTAAQNLLKD